MLKVGLKALLIGVAALALGSSADAADRLSIILTAFGDKDATFGETQPFLKALEGKVDRTADSAFCKGVFEGAIFGQPVVVVTTGTAGGNAGPCMQELLGRYGQQVREVIWSGIGGISPGIGGMVDRAGHVRKAFEPTMVGDVCISALSWNYDLAFSSVVAWDAARRAGGNLYDPAGGWFAMKDSSDKSSVIGFENVRQFTVAPRVLADDLVAAARQVAWPEPGAEVRKLDERYLGADRVRGVRVFDSGRCGEVSGDNFWFGVPEDRLARQRLASLVAASGYGPAGTSEDDVVAFTAMESAAWMSIVDRWNKHFGTDIAMAVVRAGSDYSHPALDADGNPKPGPDGKPLGVMEGILLGFDVHGAAFAWNNAALPVLKLLELRRAARP